MSEMQAENSQERQRQGLQVTLFQVQEDKVSQQNHDIYRGKEGN